MRSLLEDDVSRSVAETAIAGMPTHFGAATSIGVQMAVRATATSERGDIVAQSMTSLVADLLSALKK
jgi:hypothetical protein